MQEILLSLLGAILVNASTYLSKVQNGEKFNWGKAFRTIIIGALLGVVVGSGGISEGLNPAVYTMASAGLTGLMDQAIKAGFKYINKTFG